MLRFKASVYLYISCSTKTMDRYPGLLQFTCLFSFSCLPRVVTRSPAALTVPVVYSFRDQVPSTPCVILIADHVIVYHVLLSATSKRPKSGKHVQCVLQKQSTYRQTVHQWLSNIFPVMGCIYPLSRRKMRRTLAVRSSRGLGTATCVGDEKIGRA